MSFQTCMISEKHVSAHIMSKWGQMLFLEPTDTGELYFKPFLLEFLLYALTDWVYVYILKININANQSMNVGNDWHM